MPKRYARQIYVFLFSTLILAACSMQHKIGRSANETVVQAPALHSAHVGISIFEPATNKYWFNYQGDKYFVPASNTKIPTCYAAMKYLGDSLVGALIAESNGDIYISGTADPTFLHPDYPLQPVLSYLQSKKNKKIWLTGSFTTANGVARPPAHFGSGWAWSDYDESYMAERNFFPIYGNVVKLSVDSNGNSNIFPLYFKNRLTHYHLPGTISATREGDRNFFVTRGNRGGNTTFTIPFKTGTDPGPARNTITNTVSALLADTLGTGVNYVETAVPASISLVKIHSQPTDSVLKPMMHRSDNFFAEQVLLMVSQAKLGVLNDAAIIDTLLKTDFADLPQKPRWADGSGLSRYNLFTPQDMVAILNKARNEFGMGRIQNIFATGGEGTLNRYYTEEKGNIFAKTGTLSGVVAISGYLHTKKNKWIIFSVLVNNHQSSVADVRHAVEKFIRHIRNTF